jgi:tetratricopeptide (TPR) repeat protein
MDEERFAVTADILETLRQNDVSPEVVEALKGLVGQGFEREEDFLKAIYALHPPPRSDAEAAQILRTSDHRFRQALLLLGLAYRHQMGGKLEQAVELYKRSLALYPTAEAHTFLGWSLSFLERYDDAIAECHKAIAVDPEFGNPYNDIGSYLIALGRLRDAIPWLERATRAKRYDPRHYPWANLGRVYEILKEPDKALEHYLKAYEIEPTYSVAREAIDRLSGPSNRLN